MALPTNAYNRTQVDTQGCVASFEHERVWCCTESLLSPISCRISIASSFRLAKPVVQNAALQGCLAAGVALATAATSAAAALATAAAAALASTTTIATSASFPAFCYGYAPLA